MLKPVSPVACLLLIGMAGSSINCWNPDTCLTGGIQHWPSCQASPSTVVNLTAQPLGSNTTLQIGDVRNKLSTWPGFNLASPAPYSSRSFFLTVYIHYLDGPTSIALPSALVDLVGSAGGDEYQAGKLTAASGSLNILTNTDQTFAAEFQMELSTPRGDSYSVSGRAEAMGCHLEDHCSF
jgi:hypothetical protein